MKMKKGDLLLALGILLAALALYLLMRPGGAGAVAVVSVDGREIARYRLDQERTVTIGGEDYNVLCIADGKVWIEEANCGDGTCVRTGAVSREGTAIVCLPHKLTVRVEGGKSFGLDAAVG